MKKNILIAVLAIIAAAGVESTVFCSNPYCIGNLIEESILLRYVTYVF